MADHTPPNGRFGSLLQALNNGWNQLGGLGGSEGGDRSPLEEVSTQNLNSNLTNDKIGEDNGNVPPTMLTPIQQTEAAATPATVVTATMEDSRKRGTGSTAPKRQRKRKNDATTNASGDPGIDPPRKKVSNPAMMKEAFQNEYDSDGWEGPATGTNLEELAAADEGELPTALPGEEDEEAAVAPDKVAMEEPMHVPIDEEAFNALKVDELKHELLIRRVGLPKKKNKPDLRARLREALDKEMVVYPQSADEGETKSKKKGDDLSHFAVGAKWVELTPDIDVEEPRNDEYPEARAPTVPKEDAKVPPRPKQSFSKKFKRPKFKGRKKGGPRQEFLDKHGLNKESLPVEFVEAFFPMFKNEEKDSNGDPMFSMEYIARNTNMKANLAFAGEATYEKWSGAFSVKEIRQFLGLYVINGLSPSPSLEKKFDPHDKANFNPFVATNFGANATRRLAEFKCFMTCQDPMKPVPDRAASPLFKVLSLVKWIRRVGPMSWECGMHLGLDEQTIGFKGNHCDKLRSTYKAEGDGFQCDAICDNGFTFSVFFRNEPPPPELIRQGLSPLHARSVWLFNQLREEYHRVWCDNLYVSAGFCKAGFTSENKVIISGVARTKDRGIPGCVLQEPARSCDVPTMRGNVKAAVLQGDDDCPELVSMSLYDNKPVHFISMACEDIKWIEKERKVWNNNEKKMVVVTFLRINLNDDYNNKMNAVDVSDQLRNHYRMDYWLRQRKWWWAIFIWGVGVLITNSYKVYIVVMEMEGVPKNERLTHYDYILQIAVAWIERDEVAPREMKRRRLNLARAKERAAKAAAAQQHPITTTTTPQQSTPPRRSRSPPRRVVEHSPAAAGVSSPSPKRAESPKRAPRLNDVTLHPEKGALRRRLDHFEPFHCPVPPNAKLPACSLHRYVRGREVGSIGQKRGQIVSCSVCEVNLCIVCFKTFHTVRDIAGQKEQLASTFKDD